MQISADTFKAMMRQFVTGVTIVTTLDHDVPQGITVNAFSSVSLDPMLVMVCVTKRLYTHSLIERSGIFAVHILHQEQAGLAERFAGMVPGVQNRFEGIAYRRAATGSPILPDTLGWMDCRVWASYNGGDHTIFVGEVLDGAVEAGLHTPLLYYQRSWHLPTLLEQPDMSQPA